MSFDPNIPGPNDLLSDSQSDIQTNFSESNNIMGVNHVNFNNSLPALSVALDRGKHHVTTLIERVVGWGFDPATLPNEIALYCKDLAGVSTLFMRKENNGAVIQLSGPAASDPTGNQTFLPGGLIMKWGLEPNVLTTGATLVTFPVAFPAGCLNVIATPITTLATRASSVSTFNVAFDGFNVVVNNATSVAQNIYWIAIGN